MDEKRNQDHDNGLGEVIEVRRPHSWRGITFEWHIKRVPQDNDEGRALRARQARAIRGLLESLADQRWPGDRPASDDG